MLHHLFFLVFAHIDCYQYLLQNVVVAIVLGCYFFPFLKLFLELEVQSECFCVDLMQIR